MAFPQAKPLFRLARVSARGLRADRRKVPVVRPKQVNTCVGRMQAEGAFFDQYLPQGPKCDCIANHKGAACLTERVDQIVLIGRLQ